MEVSSLLFPGFWVILVALNNGFLLLFFFFSLRVLIIAKPELKQELSSTHNKQTSCHSAMKKCRFSSYEKNMRIRLEPVEDRNQTLLGSSEGKVLSTVLIILYNGPAHS